MDLNHLLLFKKVAELGSFSKAAAQLGLPKSNVSQKITQAEQELGVRLLNRTTRRVSLTEVGERIFEAVGRIATETEDIKALVHNLSQEPSGHLRVTAPLDLGVHIIENHLQPFLALYPKITIELDLSNRIVDLVREGFDLALRASPAALLDSTLIATAIASTRMGLYVSPRWLSLNKPPAAIQDLSAIPILWFVVGSKRRPMTWRLSSSSGGIELPLHSALMVNDLHSILRAAIAGMGIALLPQLVSQPHVKRGDLVALFPEWSTDSGDYYALIPSRKYLPNKTRVFLDFLRQALAGMTESSVMPHS